MMAKSVVGSGDQTARHAPGAPVPARARGAVRTGGSTHSPLRITPARSYASSRTTRSASLPGSSEPIRSSRPSRRAGLAESARTASVSGSRSRVTARLKAVSRVSVEPAIEPPSTSRATPVHAPRPPAGRASYRPSPKPAASIASVMNATRSAPALREGQLEDGRVQVRAVVDQLDGDPLVLQQRRDRAGRAVLERRHRVEQVGGHRRARLDGLHGSARTSRRCGRSAAITPRSASSRTESMPPGSSVASVTIFARAAGGLDQLADVGRVGVAQQRPRRARPCGTAR